MRMERRDGDGARLRRRAAAGRGDAGHLRRRDRERERRAGAHGAQRGAGARRASCARASSIMSATSCARRSPTSSASPSCWREGTVGPLNERQKEYAGHIMRSSAALMAIIDDILDLATIDTGEIELALGPVDIRETITDAIAGVQDRLAESRIRLDVQASPGLRHDGGGRQARPAGAVQPAVQCHRLLAAVARPSRSPPSGVAATSCSACATRAAASRRTSSSGSSTGSRATRRAPPIAASASACRSCGHSWSCMAARVDIESAAGPGNGGDLHVPRQRRIGNGGRRMRSQLAMTDTTAGWTTGCPRPPGRSNYRTRPRPTHLARELGAMFQAGDLVTLSGDLGAGKTTFARCADPLHAGRRQPRGAEPHLHAHAEL